MKIQLSELKKIIRSVLKESSMDADKYNAFVSSVMTTELEPDDYKYIRFRQNQLGGLDIFDFDGMLGHIEAEVPGERLQQAGIELGTLMKYITDRGGRAAKGV